LFREEIDGIAQAPVGRVGHVELGPADSFGSFCFTPHHAFPLIGSGAT
jgi:hypothetical protein